jgi:hypothetical protein
MTFNSSTAARHTYGRHFRDAEYLETQEKTFYHISQTFQSLRTLVTQVTLD